MTTLTVAIPLMVLIQITWAMEISSCGRLPQYNFPQMIRSNNTQHHWPWHAAIYHRLADSKFAYQCGGTLIAANWVLTAAHCVLTATRRVKVSLGRLNLAANENRSEQSFWVDAIIRHENFSEIDLHNDIALVHLSGKAEFTHFVRPICLWRYNETDLSTVIGRNGTVVGWGKTEAYELSTRLREASFEVISHIRCLESNRDFYGIYLSKTSFCAGQRNGESTCDGDSGGSMTFVQNEAYYIRGIVSQIPAKLNHSTQRIDCDTMEYALYTDVAQYLRWISDKTMTECQIIVRCDRETLRKCEVSLHSQSTEWNCKITFDDISDSITASLTVLGESKSVSDFSDAISIESKDVDRVRLIFLRRIERLALSGVQITQLNADAFEELHNVELLELSYNRLASLPDGLFRNNRKLQRIDLNGNVLSELHVNIFKELHNLTSIYLYNNRLDVLPQGLLLNNAKLQTIYLNGNLLTGLHADIFSELHDLTKINLHDNRLETLPCGLFRNTRKLQGIYLDGNLLTELHADIFSELHDVTNMFLYDNKLETLPHGLFRNNRKLQQMYLNGNLLTGLHPDIFKELHDLTNMLLYDNKLETLPHGLFRDTRKLQGISLDDNLLTELHSDIFSELHNITKVELNDNKIETLPHGLFRNNKQLYQIELERNLLKELQADIFEELQDLEWIFLNENKLKTVPQGLFSANRKLLKIKLQRNLLNELHRDTFKGLHDLEQLFLYDNQLTTLPQGIFQDNRNLLRIELQNNKLKEIETDFSNLSKLSTLDLRGNVCIDEFFDTLLVILVESEKIRTKCFK